MTPRMLARCGACPYLWLSWAAGRHRAFPEALASESLERQAKWLNEFDLASVFVPRWDRLSTVPTVSQADVPADQIWAEFAALWPRIGPE
ncbi:MAG: hypothetical protein OWU33_04615 [Firmicutes bacterium]|nr:hypothetical protein [Bacillota bacterium]